MSWSKQARFDAVEVVSDVRHGEFQRTSSVLIGIGSVITAAEIFFERSALRRHRRDRMDLRPARVRCRHRRAAGAGRRRLGRNVGHRPLDGDATCRAQRDDIGVVNYAISAVDVALWDLKSRLPLTDLKGAARDTVPVYGSGGFTTYDDQQTIEQLGLWAHEQHIPRVKIKIGESGGTCEDRDIHRMEVARRTIGPRAELYVDANGAYTAEQAVRLMRATAALDVRWIEEPVSSDDLAGLHEVRSLVDADVAAGEYGFDVTYFGRMCAAGAVDCLQVDATRAGGYTGWQHAAVVAAQHGLQVSGHCAPNLHASVAAATPNLRHLEWFHDHQRIESMLFHGALGSQRRHRAPEPQPAGARHGFRRRDSRDLSVLSLHQPARSNADDAAAPHHLDRLSP